MKVTCSRAVCAALLCFALPLTLFAQNFENAKDITWPTLWAVWHDLSPTDADLDALVNQQNQIRQSANAANQAELIQIAKSAFSRTLESANKSDLFRIYTNSRLSNYDDERGGAYLELFEGGRFFTINNHARRYLWIWLFNLLVQHKTLPHSARNRQRFIYTTM
jgi:hypothetical protein